MLCCFQVRKLFDCHYSTTDKQIIGFVGQKKCWYRQSDDVGKVSIGKLEYCQTSVPTKLIVFSESAIGWNKGKYIWQYSKHSYRKLDKFVEMWHLVYFNTGLVQNLGHINVFLWLWVQLFKENLGTRRLAIKLEGTQQHSVRLYIYTIKISVRPSKKCFYRLHELSI